MTGIDGMELHKWYRLRQNTQKGLWETLCKSPGYRFGSFPASLRSFAKEAFMSQQPTLYISLRSGGAAMHNPRAGLCISWDFG